MKLSKAIENLRRGRKDAGMIPGKEYTATIDLATEAMKAIQRHRHTNMPAAFIVLKGETPE